ncbi:MAG: DUF2812 domain-containing protein [Intestinibacter sp.]|uniref:DUF2812 domain-containing protein n=1 Tax=Intestinibacter sp. TaxID=1965304 RepID=UPI0025C355B6|nr:DUF2812 domain-containing protein [Intestinibacter sp.]MCI6738227.1 DUF2812 domain-containing protein [Intestinibacter sp.]
MKVGKDKLIKFVLFRENDCSALELYLEEMAQKGWMFDSVSPIMHLLQFKKCKPQKVKFCVDIREEFSKDFMSEFNLPQYIDMCEHEGWKHITDVSSFTSAIGSSSSYQVFISDDINTPDIQTDDKLKLEPIFKSSVQNIIISIILMIYSIYNIKSTYSTDFEMLNWAFLSIIIALIPYINYIIESLIWFFRAKKSLSENRPIRYVSLNSLKLKTTIIDLIILMFLICILFFYTLIHMDTSVQFFILNILKAINLIIFIFGFVFLIEVIRENIVPIDKINK